MGWYGFTEFRMRFISLLISFFALGEPHFMTKDFDRHFRPLPPWDSRKTDDARPRWQSQTKALEFESPWISVERHQVLAPTGNVAQYGLVRFANRAVGVLPLHADGTVTLIGQMRFSFDAYSWEMPEGGVPWHENAALGARRELMEETGLLAENLVEILNFDLSNSVTDEVAICFLATGLTNGPSCPDDTERLEVKRIPFKQVMASVINGEIRDSLTVATVLKVHYMAVCGQLAPELAAHILG
jgi:8-oxo-dGTP pyrophosphatase MutT (NUDIX family)